MTCKNNFKLPELNFIGGNYKEIPFVVEDLDNGGVMDLSNVKLIFSLTEYQQRNSDTPLLSKELMLDPDNPTLAKLYLDSADTINLKGRYIYQITVKAPNNKKEHFQGSMTIDSNIDPTI